LAPAGAVSRFLAARLGTAALVLGLTLAVAFVLFEALPGGPGAAFEDARVPAAERARLRSVLGLDRPAPERFVRFARAALAGDWGVSFAQQRPVARVVREALPYTAWLALAALVVELGLGVSLGALAARHAGRWVDRATRAFSIALWSVPSFWLALVLLRALAIELPLFPAGGAGSAGGRGGAGDALAHLVLPALALGLPAAAATARFVRAALLDVAAEPFVAAARARGLGELAVFGRHTLRAAAAPLVQLTALSAGGLLSGALAVEVAFSRPGLGRVAADALAARDYPVLLATTALATAAVVAATLAGDLAHGALDARVRRHDPV
jgi:peptide/nickel transport system permease protein